jgi:hypothetical protein
LINPTIGDAKAELAVAFALQTIAPETAQVLADAGGLIPADSSLDATDPITETFRDAALNGTPQPHSAQFPNALQQAVNEACRLMNEANGL